MALNSQYIHSNLALRYLDHYTRDLPYTCRIKEFTINNRIEEILEGILFEKPDLVCFSTYIWNVTMVKDLGKLIKSVYPDIQILYGGPEVSFHTEAFMESCHWANYVIVGEGEETYREFIQSKLSKNKIDQIKGLYYRDKNKTYFHGKRDNIDMNDLVFPYDEKEDLDNKILYYESSRGCPFRCKYCLSSTDRNLRFLHVDRVKKELQYFLDKKVKLLKFVDRTFNAKHEYAMEIWKYLMENDNGYTCFHFEISSDILRKEQIELIGKARSGLFQFEVGVQSTNENTLRDINRFVKFEDIMNKVLSLKQCNNVKQHLDLIAGLPEEDYNSFKKSFNDVYSLKPDEIQLGFLKVLKGTVMEEEKDKWGLVYSHIPPYEILKTKYISYHELMKLKKIESMVDRYYNSSKFSLSISYLEEKFESAFDFYEKLSVFALEQGYFHRSVTFSQYYGLLMDFNESYFSKDKDGQVIFKNLLRMDYIINNKKTWIPDFLRVDVTKSEVNKIKEELIEKDLIKKGDKIYIEKFNMDISRYIKYKKLIENVSYLVFYEDGHYFSIKN